MTATLTITLDNPTDLDRFAALSKRTKADPRLLVGGLSLDVEGVRLEDGHPKRAVITLSESR